MNFNQKTYVFRFKNICFLFLDSQSDVLFYGFESYKSTLINANIGIYFLILLPD